MMGVDTLPGVAKSTLAPEDPPPISRGNQLFNFVEGLIFVLAIIFLLFNQIENLFTLVFHTIKMPITNNWL